MHDPMKDLRESMKALQMHDPMKEIRESMKALQMHDPMKEIRESMKALQMHDPMKDLRESMKALQMHDPMNEIRESMKALQMHDPMKEIRESMKAFQALGTLGNLVNGITDERWELILDGTSGIEVHADGQVTIDSILVTQEKIQDIAQQAISNSIEIRALQFEQYVDSLINEIRSLKDPIHQRLLAWFIYPLIVGLVLSVVNPVADYYIKEALNNYEKRQVVKDVSKAITNTIDNKSYLNSFRVVSTTSLNVRKLGSTKSDVVGKLYLGDVVEVIEKGRNWSLISWQDTESDVLVRGWVFSRYLKAIK
ncbi:SH3 domain-containing protein [Plesiomonas shigelloides]|uniref:SH3 domain-containing protein n=1 Tax=Plesiomonas shigelloides TaxID=703 RepID=UPI0012614C90|nr:SH3 domain-containing protein [Plesiomonas shigelloides]KAB7660569.1 SH3 domain-containing protein [Plesiomonas shigelloides]